jgi:hypothetical protein
MMAGKEETRRLIEQAEAAVRRHRDEQERYLAMLDFNWRNVPKRDHGAIGANPLGTFGALEIELPDGRLIELRELHQYYAYHGTLCGVPPTPENELVEALKTAQRVFPQFGMRPVMLQPVFHGGTFKRRPGEKPHPYPLVWLPQICTIAQFVSGALAHAGSHYCSSLVVIWFQETYGLVDDVRTLAQLRELDWETQAIDWSP